MTNLVAAHIMIDFLYLLTGVAVLVGFWFFTKACDRL